MVAGDWVPSTSGDHISRLHINSLHGLSPRPTFEPMTLRLDSISLVVVVGVLCATPRIHAQQTTAVTKAPTKTILAIGAHAGDMELTAGAVLINQRKLG